MSWKEWWAWFKLNWHTGEAAATYVTFLAGIALSAIIATIRWLTTRKRPSIVRIMKMYESSLIDVAPQIKERLEVTYDGQPIEGFYDTRFMIQNTGDSPIENIDLVFAIEELSTMDFLEVTFSTTERIERFTVPNPAEMDTEASCDGSLADQSNTEISSYEYSSVERDPDTFSVLLPFLNPRKVYEDYLGITIYSPKPLIVKGVVGKGPGWTTKYVDTRVYFDRILSVWGGVASPVAVWALKLVFFFFR